jgi:hypothetical protein
MRRLVPGGLVLALALVGAAGCSKSAQLEDEIATQFQKEVSIPHVNVTCPEGVKAKKDEEVQCTAEGDFSPLGVTGNRLTLFIKFESDDNFAVTDFSADGQQFTITTSPASSSP